MDFSAGLLALIILSSVCWSLFDVFRKQLTSQYSAVSLAIWLLAAQALFFLLLLPTEAMRFEWEPYWLPGGVNILLNLVADLCFLLSVRLAPLSVTVPILSFTPLFASIGSWIILGEQLTPIQWLGMALIVAGAIWLSRKTGASLKGKDVSDLYKALLLMLVTALVWAIAPVLDKICLGFVSPNLHAEIQISGILVLLFILLKLKGETFQMIKMGKPVVALSFATVMFCVALISQFQAIMLMPVGLFEALKRGINLTCAVGFGYLFFQEPVNKIKVFSIGLMIVGVAVLLLT